MFLRGYEEEREEEEMVVVADGKAFDSFSLLF